MNSQRETEQGKWVSLDQQQSRMNEIENMVAGGFMTAPQCFTQMKQLIQAAWQAATEQGERCQILKGVGKINGDGWKDTTVSGEVIYVWNDEQPKPYKPGQYPRIGNGSGWTASIEQYDFYPATIKEAQEAVDSLFTTQPPAEQGVGEAVAYMVTQSGEFCFATQHRPSISPEEMSDSELDIVPLYTHPPKPTGGGVPDRGWQLMPVNLSYEERAKALLHFNTTVQNGGDHDDGLQAAYAALLATQQPPEQE